ncbi:dihydrolipoamide acetyltransferase family protein [Nocardioides alkalitolerans]|uniref:dihydrolipoamide acetyltransferase family protein n=1 Tax=Nocardioides alkalitolerans TaxID=281714 RepID=UPI0004062858|nr:dihydrolipoamide acetyltransferase family protein [Nocardioides alkalitolerans]
MSPVSAPAPAGVSRFHLPDVGEGLTEAEIVAWHVAVGDVVEVNQPLVDIETAKSVVELPSPYAGTVVELHAAVGETVDVGVAIISIATEAAPAATAAEAPAAPAAPEPAAEETEPEPKLLVGYGAREDTGGRRRRRRGGAAAGTTDAAERPVLAKPPVRKLAKVLGVDLASLTPSGPGGTTTRADVLDASEGRAPAAPTPAHPAPTAAPAVRDEPTATAPAAPAEEQAPEGDLRIPIKGVRKHTAAAMVRSAFTAPHVTEFVTLDMTRTMELRDAVVKRREFRDVKVSPLAFVARAFLLAMARTPEANSRWDEEAQEIVQLREVNLGIAAATPRGLIVPNIKSAQRLPLRELSTAINDLAATARAGRTSPADQAGGTVTITNVGVFGVDTGTPILNPGEVAILAFGAVRRTPWVVTDADGTERIEPRWVTQLALSFDHRVLDGQQGSELLADTAAILTDPGLALL